MRAPDLSSMLASLAVLGLVGLLGVVGLSGCTKHEPPPDPLVAELHAAMVQTLSTMGEPALDARMLDDEALRLAWQADRERMAGIRAGSLAPGQLASIARSLAHRIETARPGGVKAPRMMVWLADHADALGKEQQLLLEATSEQAARELPKPPKQLAAP